MACLLILVIAGRAIPAPAQLTPEQRLGKQIYQRGIGSSGQPITAVMGETDLAVPAATLTCSGCHGDDGRGRPEGGVSPSDITWAALTKPYGVTHESGRKHPPYSEAALRQAITAGIDPGGNRLSAAMPAYRMGDDELGALIAYLKVLRRDDDPGVSGDTLRIGTVLPSSGEMASLGAEVRAVLQAYVAVINRQGGIYNRKIELDVIDAQQAAPALESALEQRPVFAMLAPFSIGVEKQLSDFWEARQMPAIAPLTMAPVVAAPPNRYVFYIFPGVREQALTLAEFAAHEQPPSPAAIVYPKREDMTAIAGLIEARFRQWRKPPPVAISYPPGQFDAPTVVRELSTRAETVFVLGSGAEQAAFIQAAQEVAWKPHILIPGSLAGGGILENAGPLGEQIFLALPMLSSEKDAQLIADLVRPAKREVASRHLAFQVWAYCAVRILVEALKACGRDLNREKLVSALEGLYEFDSGLGVQVTYGPNRRIGALGAYIVSARFKSKRFVTVADWADNADLR